ncbi:hypothetical protein D1007_63092 [Hordeum vulgare]|nr:hypothetical protein D1007_63092 [Hordeum vulgare]
MSSLSSGSWEGSIMIEERIEHLRRTGDFRSRSSLRPARPIAPDPRDGECVVFRTHFEFLDFYGLQMHHLVPNSVLYLACFVTLCEVYLGFWPFPSFFCHIFYFRVQMHGAVWYSCNGMVVYRRSDCLFPKMKFKDSFKKW